MPPRILLLLLLFLLLLWPQPSQAQTSPVQTSPVQTSPVQTSPVQTSPVWFPAPAEVPYLAAETRLQHFALCPPAGFTLIASTSFASGRKEYRFIGARRGDGSAPTLIVTAEVGEKAGAGWTVAEGMRELLHTQDDTLTLDKMTDTQHGSVSGFAALRAYGKGNALVNTHIDGPGVLHHRLAHLIVYGVGDDRLAVIALALDLEPHVGAYDPQALLRMEASMQTLRLTDAPPPPPAPMVAILPGQWLPRADLLSFLAPESVINGLAIRIPRGFDPITLDFGGKDASMFGFGWQAHGSQSSVVLRFIIETLPPGETPRSLPAVMTDLAAAEGEHQKNYTHSPIEYGVTGFGASGRFTGSGIIPVLGNSVVVPRTCTVYGILTRTQFIRIEALTADPRGASLMQVMAASILTGRFAAPEAR